MARCARFIMSLTTEKAHAKMGRGYPNPEATAREALLKELRRAHSYCDIAHAADSPDGSPKSTKIHCHEWRLSHSLVCPEFDIGWRQDQFVVMRAASLVLATPVGCCSEASKK